MSVITGQFFDQANVDVASTAFRHETNGVVTYTTGMGGDKLGNEMDLQGQSATADLVKGFDPTSP